MAENWAADVKKKYVPNADEKAIDGIVKYCGIALQKRFPPCVLHRPAIERAVPTTWLFRR